jgi:hypothetical protein
MEDKPVIAHHSDSDEKTVDSPVPYTSDLPSDPDAHLSPEEKAAVVSPPSAIPLQILIAI